MQQEITQLIIFLDKSWIFTDKKEFNRNLRGAINRLHPEEEPYGIFFLQMLNVLNVLFLIVYIESSTSTGCEYLVIN